MLSRDQIFAASDIKTEVVEVPEWGGSVIAKGLSGTEVDDYQTSMLLQKKRGATVTLVNLRSKLVVRGTINEDGTPLFRESDVEAVGKKSAAALERVFKVIQRLSGLSDEDVEELAKNSEAGPSGDSTSASPAT